MFRLPVASLSYNFRYDLFYNRKYSHNTKLEILWTLFPCIILSFILFPSISLLYAMDEVFEPALTVKVLASQWYWSYEYSNVFIDQPYNTFFDSYMLGTADLEPGQMRLLEVDNFAVFPKDFNIRILVTSNDVLHSWAVPSFGLKIDAIPGRINQVLLLVDRLGIFYGQCSELCGVNHGFMPICVRVVESADFFNWVFQKSEVKIDNINFKNFFYNNDFTNAVNKEKPAGVFNLKALAGFFCKQKEINTLSLFDNSFFIFSSFFFKHFNFDSNNEKLNLKKEKSINNYFFFFI